MQEKVNNLETTAQKVGLKTSHENTKLLRTNNQQNDPVTVSEKVVTDVDDFVYLGSKLCQTGGTDEDIKARLKKAWQAFTMLRLVWRANCIFTKTKLRISNSNVKSVLLYGSETWKVINTNTAKMETFVNGCLRHIFRLRWSDSAERRAKDIHKSTTNKCPS